MNLDTLENKGHARDPNDRRLGQLLRRKHMLTEEQLQEGLDAQIINGGRLGTNLVELELLTEAQLADALQEQHQVEVAHGEIVPHEDALGTIRRELCDRHDLLPVRLEKRPDGEALYLAVVKPMPPAHVDELSRRLKMFVHQIVVPEFRMNQMLRRYAKAYRPVRQVDLTHAAMVQAEKEQAKPVEDLMGEEEFQSLYANAVSGGRHDHLDDVHDEHHETLAAPAEHHADLHSGHQSEVKPVIDLSHHDDPAHPVNASHPPAPLAKPVLVPSRPPPPPPDAVAGKPPAPVVKPYSFMEAQAALLQTDDRADIAHVVMRYAAGAYKRAVLFALHGDTATGWEGVGRGLEGDVAHKLGVSLREGAFRQVWESGKHVIGAIPETASVGAFFKLIGGAPQTAVLVPILVRGKVANLLYADAGPGRPTNPDATELEVLAGKVGHAYEAILAKRKAEVAAQLLAQG